MFIEDEIPKLQWRSSDLLQHSELYIYSFMFVREAWWIHDLSNCCGYHDDIALPPSFHPVVTLTVLQAMDYYLWCLSLWQQGYPCN